MLFIQQIFIVFIRVQRRQEDKDTSSQGIYNEGLAGGGEK